MSNEVQTSAANFIFGPNAVINDETNSNQATNVDENVDERDFTFVSVPVSSFYFFSKHSFFN